MIRVKRLTAIQIAKGYHLQLNGRFLYFSIGWATKLTRFTSAYIEDGMVVIERDRTNERVRRYPPDKLFFCSYDMDGVPQEEHDEKPLWERIEYMRTLAGYSSQNLAQKMEGYFSKPKNQKQF